MRTHQSQSPAQREIIKKLPELWYESEKTKYRDLERKFIEKFFEFRKQPAALSNSTFLVAYAASVSTAIVAHFFSRKKLSVSVIEPCFDNLVDLLKLANNKLEVLPEEIIFKSKDLYQSLADTVHSDVIYITDPNNPTGESLSLHGKKYWSELIRFCKDYKKILMLDLCFSPFLYASEKYKPFDLYELLEDSGISYICLEDTGKSWPVQDMKASILKSSTDLYDELFSISTIYLLCVSPFALRVLIEYIEDAIKSEFKYSKKLIQTNWNIIRRCLKDSLLQIKEPVIPVPVVWCKLPKNVNGDELKKFLEEYYTVHVVPGKYFFWKNKNINNNYIRVALARDPESFEESAQELRKGLDAYEKKIK